jgi:hypothetical protein
MKCCFIEEKLFWRRNDEIIMELNLYLVIGALQTVKRNPPEL